jgi:ketosteroid isomerase-like protein
MSEQSREIVRDALDAFSRGDLEKALERLAPDAEMDWTRAVGPYRGVYRADQVQQFIEDYTTAFESVWVETGELIDAGDQVIAVLTFHVRSRDGLEAKANTVQVWTIEGGRVTRVCMYQGREEALDAAGLGT